MAAECEGKKYFCIRRYGSLATVALAASLCFSATNAPASEPQPVRPFYNQFNAEDEGRLGSALAGKIEREGIPIANRHGKQQILRVRRDFAIERYLENIVSRLAQSSQRPEIHYSVRILDAPDVINAFSIPGGHVYVSSGLLDFVETEAELAAVLGHEVGHIVGRHSMNRIARASLFSWLIDQARESGLISDEATAKRLADSAMPILFAIDSHTFYSRDEEIEADLLSLYEMSRAGWNPRSEILLLARLAKTSPAESPLFSLIATHPDPFNRLLVVKREYKTANFPDAQIVSSSQFRTMKLECAVMITAASSHQKTQF